MRSFSFPSLLLSSNFFTSNVFFSSINTSQTLSLGKQKDINQPDMNEFHLEQHNLDTIPDLFASESHQMPSKNTHLYSTFRQDAVSLFLQAQCSCNLDPFVTYLSINYLDRFISKREIPQEKPWVPRLVLVSCLSLAAKMKNSPFSSSDFQRGEAFIFDVPTIHKMELLILDTLDWRMRSITPFSFLHFFICLLELNDRPFTQALELRAWDVIFNAHTEIKFLEFKPSIIAAAAVLSTCHELLPLQCPSFKASISACQYVNKGSLLKCLNLVQEMIENEGYESMFDTLSCTRTPVSVLECDFTRSESENTISTATNTTSTTTYRSSMSMIAAAEKKDSKRRRLNGSLGSENKFEISHHFQEC